MAGLIDGILENSVSAGLENNLKNAITDVGGEVPTSACLWQYPQIIRNNLIARSVSGINILGGDLINIDTTVNGDTLIYNINTVFDTNGIPRPNYAWENTKWGKEINAKELFDDLFTNILPAVRGVFAGDMTMTDSDGKDTKTWENTLFNESGYTTDLLPSTRYIRLYLTCQAQPIYINIGNLIEEMTNKYNVKSTDTVTLELDDDTNTISASINIISEKQLSKLN